MWYVTNLSEDFAASIFSILTSCGVLVRYQRYKGPCCLHLRDYVATKIVATIFSEISWSYSNSLQRQNAEDLRLEYSNMAPLNLDVTTTVQSSWKVKWYTCKIRCAVAVRLTAERYALGCPQSVVTTNSARRTKQLKASFAGVRGHSLRAQWVIREEYRGVGRRTRKSASPTASSIAFWKESKTYTRIPRKQSNLISRLTVLNYIRRNFFQYIQPVPSHTIWYYEIWMFTTEPSRGLLGCALYSVVVGYQPWRWRQPTTLHGVTTHKTSTQIFTAMKTSNFTAETAENLIPCPFFFFTTYFCTIHR
jgi:hypothetical protein